MMTVSAFKKYFTLEEAVDLLPDVAFTLQKARQQLAELRDGVILSKRMIQARQQEGKRSSDAELALLQQKYTAFEEQVNHWIGVFAAQGIILRDPETGLIDFPYHSQSRQEDYFLCWRPEEDGIFYFHSISEGFAGRHPISLLPE
jgi:hypothetical protein